MNVHPKLFTEKDAPELIIKDFDAKEGIVKGVLSKFGVVDSDGDMLMPGAFKKSISERGPQSANAQKIAFLRSHNADKPVGKFTELEETAEGLEYVAKMSKSSIGQDTLILITEGIINNHSIGYIPMREKEEMKEDYTEVHEVKLMEGSILVFGANPETPVTFVKGMSEEEKLSALQKKTDKVIKVLRGGVNLQDETFALLEIQLEQIKALQHALMAKEPPSTPDRDEPLRFDLDWPLADPELKFNIN